MDAPGEVTFTGDYIDWDSTLIDFKGVASATATEVGNQTNSVTSAPNGRIIMTLSAKEDVAVDFVHTDYIPLRFTEAAEASAAGPFSVKGLTPARADALFTEIGKTRDPARAHVLIAMTTYDNPGEGNAIGTEVTLGNANDGGFTSDATGKYVAGTKLTDDRYVFFANVDVSDGSTTVKVSPVAGKSCRGPAKIELVAGQLAATNYACTK